MSRRDVRAFRTVVWVAAVVALLSGPAQAASRKPAVKKTAKAAASKSKTTKTSSSPTVATTAASTPAPSGGAGRGGSAVFGVDAECPGFLPTVAGWGGACGTMTAAVYDRWMSIDRNGDAVPNLIESAKPSSDYKTWTFTIRSGIKFHNGEALDGSAFVANMDAMRTGALSASALVGLKECTSSGQTATCTFTRRWVTFPSLLGQNVGSAIAPAQLAAKDTRHLVGTGPFMCVGDCWTPGQKLSLVKNPNYWRKGLPKLDALEFRPVPDEDQRLAQLDTGQIQFMMTQYYTTSRDIASRVKDGKVGFFSDVFGGPAIYDMPNLAKPGPMQDIRVRRAWAYAIDLPTLSKLRAPGAALSNGIFGKGAPGYLAESGYPTYDPDKAKALLDDYKKDKGISGPVKITHLDTAVPDNQQTIAVMKQMLDKVGFDVTILPGLDLAGYSRAITTGQFDVARNLGFAFLDPDLMRAAIHSDGCGGPAACPKSIGTATLNINRISDDVIDSALDQIRENSDPAVRKRAAESINRQLGDNAYLLYRWRGIFGLASCKTCGGGDDFRGVDGQKLVTTTQLAYLGTAWLTVG